MTKILHFIKLRTFCEASPEQLLIDRPVNPLKRIIKTDDSNQKDFVKQYLSNLKVPIQQEDSTTLLQDKPTSGWLAFEKTLTFYVQAGEESPFKWDPTSAEAISAISSFVEDPSWWSRVSQSVHLPYRVFSEQHMCTFSVGFTIFSRGQPKVPQRG